MSGRGKSDREADEQGAVGAPEQVLGAQDAVHPASPSDPEQAGRDAAPVPEASEETPAQQAGSDRKLRARPKGGYLDRSLQARIGSILRDSFTDIEREPLPERLQELVKALQAGEKPR